MSAATPLELPPATRMVQMIHGVCVSRCVSVVAELAIAELLADGPRNVAGLAATTGTNPDALYRVLRALAALGVFWELPDRNFQNNALSETLMDHSTGSLRHYARWFGQELHWRIWSGLDYSVRTGQPWATRDHPGKTPFEVLAAHPADQSVFNEAMADISAGDGPEILQAYDFSPFQNIVDIGGGNGTLATLIAAKAPHARVTAFDLPHVIEEAAKRLSGRRIDLRSGSFLETVPGPTDLCILKHVLHDWDDDTVRRILTNCRNALSHQGRVLICEMVISAGPEAIPALVLDIEMLVGPGGRERTAEEFAELCAAAGLRLERVISTRTPIRLLEAVKAAGPDA